MVFKISTRMLVHLTDINTRLIALDKNHFDMVRGLIKLRGSEVRAEQMDLLIYFAKD